MNNKIKLVKCKDGSHTLYRTDLNEHYHSTYGAIQESQHIFIDAGLKKIIPFNRKISILEVGFGTGLNALLSCIVSNKEGKLINYFSVDPFIIDHMIIAQLNYIDLIEDKGTEHIFQKIHSSAWNGWHNILDTFNLYKSNTKIEDTDIKYNHFDIIYFDAFAPDKQQELWAISIFAKLYQSLKDNGVLITYSCKGNVKRTLKEVGFNIEKLPGPKGKREILKATKQVKAKSKKLKTI